MKVFKELTLYKNLVESQEHRLFNYVVFEEGEVSIYILDSDDKLPRFYYEEDLLSLMKSYGEEEIKVVFNKARMEDALKSTFKLAPAGMTREEKRVFISGENNG